MRFQLATFLLFAHFAFGFQSAPVPIGPGVVRPMPTYQQEPKYTAEGQNAHIQGIVMLSLVVDEQGRATQISVLSPLGYGLDEAAITAVSHWKFKPGTKDGKPVSIFAQVEVTFGFENQSFDPKAERQRASYNVALHAVQEGTKANIKPLEKLASEKYPPGMYLYGKLLVEGRDATTDPDQGFRLIQESAEKKFCPALYEVARARLEGNHLDKDPAKGMELMQSAAKFGVKAAQEFLGQAYEKGDGVTVDFDKSRQYFRLCASAGDSMCQFHLGKSLLEHSDNPSRDYVQAIAWLQLAANQKIDEAEKVLQQEDARLTPAQVASAKQLMTHLVHAQ